MRGLEITEIPRDSKKMTELELERRACFVTKLLSVNDRISEFKRHPRLPKFSATDLALADCVFKIQNHHHRRRRRRRRHHHHRRRRHHHHHRRRRHHHHHHRRRRRRHHHHHHIKAYYPGFSTLEA